MSIKLKRSLTLAGAMLLLAAPATGMANVNANASVRSANPTARQANEQAREFHELEGHVANAHLATREVQNPNVPKGHGDPDVAFKLGNNNIQYNQGLNYALVNGKRVPLAQVNAMFGRRVVPAQRVAGHASVPLHANTNSNVNGKQNARSAVKPSAHQDKLAQTGEANNGAKAGIMAGVVALAVAGVTSVRKFFKRA